MSEAANFIRDLVEERKREVRVLYSELKLRVPSCIKSATIHQIRQAGGEIDQVITVPKSAEDLLRKQMLIDEKFKEIKAQFRNQVMDYYSSIRQELPPELLEKKLSDLDMIRGLPL